MEPFVKAYYEGKLDLLINLIEIKDSNSYFKVIPLIIKRLRRNDYIQMIMDVLILSELFKTGFAF